MRKAGFTATVSARALINELPIFCPSPRLCLETAQERFKALNRALGSLGKRSTVPGRAGSVRLIAVRLLADDGWLCLNNGMADDPPLNMPGQSFSEELAKFESTKRRQAFRGIALAVLNVIPWVGGFIAALAAIPKDFNQTMADSLQRQWMEEHERKLKELSDTLSEMLNRLDSFGEETKQRLESEAYLSLIRSGFRQWDQSDTKDKKKLIVNLLTNAGGTRITSDDVVRLFLDWIDAYHEIHFAVIREVHKREGVTRKEIWNNIYGSLAREDSAEADLFKMLMRDLSIGGVLHQHREKGYYGERLSKTRSKPIPGGKPPVSAFDDEEGYELTALGRQFVHYAMSEGVPRVQ